jgi:hypothetical protein
VDVLHTAAPACLLLAAAWSHKREKATGFSAVAVLPLGLLGRWLLALLLPVVGLFLAGVALRDIWGWVGPVLAGIVAVPVVIVVGRRYNGAVRADVRGRA